MMMWFLPSLSLSFSAAYIYLASPNSFPPLLQLLILQVLQSNEKAAKYLKLSQFSFSNEKAGWFLVHENEILLTLFEHCRIVYYHASSYHFTVPATRKFIQVFNESMGMDLSQQKYQKVHPCLQ
jgi:hypothetical protein